jgi:hypothetical protein
MLYNLYDKCLVKEDFFAIRWELADLQQCHTKVRQGQFLQSLPPFLQAPTSKKCSIRAIDKDRPTPIVPRNPKGVHRPNKEQHSTLHLQFSEYFNDVVLRAQQIKLIPNLPSTNNSICVNWHVNGRCHNNCECKNSHKNLPIDIVKGMEVFLKVCRVAHKKVIENKDKK